MPVPAPGERAASASAGSPGRARPRRTREEALSRAVVVIMVVVGVVVAGVAVAIFSGGSPSSEALTAVAASLTVVVFAAVFGVNIWLNHAYPPGQQRRAGDEDDGNDGQGHVPGA